MSSDETQSASLFIGIEITARLRTTTFKGVPTLTLVEDELPMEGTEWVSVRANTSLDHLLEKYGERLIFYSSHWLEKRITILAWDVVDKEQRSVRVLVRKQE